MYKDNLKVTENQHSNANSSSDSSYNRLIRRSRAFWRLEREGMDPQWLYRYIDSKMGVGKELSPQLMEHILFMASRGLFCFASTAWLAGLMDCHVKSVCRISKDLADLGIIRKWYRGVGRSVALLLNPIFNNPVIQFTLAGFFPFLRAGVVSFIMSPDGKAVSNLPSFNRSLVSTHVTYNKNLTPSLNIKPCSVVEAKQSGGATPVKCSVLGRGVVATLLLATFREKPGWQTLNVPIDPRDKTSLKRSSEYTFDPQPAPVKATNESFDLFDVSNSEEREMYRREMPEVEPTFVAPPLEDDSEEVFVQAGELEQLFEQPHEEPALAEPALAEPTFVEPVQRISQTHPLKKLEKVEAAPLAPFKPWNAPPWRKVACQADVELLEEFQHRQLIWHLKESERNEKHTASGRPKWTP